LLGETADFSLLMLCCWLSETANFPKVWCFCCLLSEVANFPVLMVLLFAYWNCKSSLSSDTFANLLKWNCWILSRMFYLTKISQGCKIKKFT
jgi:hypothetical protein